MRLRDVRVWRKSEQFPNGGEWFPASVSDLVSALLEQGAETFQYVIGEKLASPPFYPSEAGRYLIFRIEEEKK